MEKAMIPCMEEITFNDNGEFITKHNAVRKVRVFKSPDGKMFIFYEKEVNVEYVEDENGVFYRKYSEAGDHIHM